MTKNSTKTEIVQCSTCKREFERYRKDRKNKTIIRGRNIRPSCCKTCSKECSKEKYYSKMTNKNKPMPLRESIWKKQNKTKWKVVNAEGNTLETFRTKPTAIKWKRKHELWLNEFSVVSI